MRKKTRQGECGGIRRLWKIEGKDSGVNEREEKEEKKRDASGEDQELDGGW